MIDYTKLFELLKERGMKKTDLLSVISSPTLAKLGKNESLTMKTTEKLCLFLKVQPSDIMEVIQSEHKQETKKEKERGIAIDFLEGCIYRICEASSDEELNKYYDLARKHFDKIYFLSLCILEEKKG